MKCQILKDLFQSQELANLLRKVEPEHLRDDLRQELFLVLCQETEEKIISLHEQGALRFYATRVVWNMAASNQSRFYKTYRRPCVSINEDEEVDHSIRTIENMLNRSQCLTAEMDETAQREFEHTVVTEAVERALSTLTEYQRELFFNYVEYGSAEKLRKAMLSWCGHAIPKRSILQTVKNTREAILKEVSK